MFHYEDLIDALGQENTDCLIKLTTARGGLQKYPVNL